MDWFFVKHKKPLGKDRIKGYEKKQYLFKTEIDRCNQLF